MHLLCSSGEQDKVHPTGITSARLLRAPDADDAMAADRRCFNDSLICQRQRLDDAPRLLSISRVFVYVYFSALYLHTGGR